MSKFVNYGGSTSIILEKKKKIAQLIIARLDGRDINKKFKYYQFLVRKGIGGFIVFGGKIKELRDAVKKLQNEAEIPLFIASDLEQGLGQQIDGGTLFPPAMAFAKVISQKNKDDVNLLRRSIQIIAVEAKAVGINVIFAPVLDVNTNPKNPIICTRAFSNDPEKVAWFGKEFIKGFQRHRLFACVKHFPGHGDTTEDSHRELPIVKANIKRLYNVELYPFAQAIKTGVKMIMVGHLKVPVLDSKFPTSLSQRVIEGLLKEKMKFKGLVITDAINMHAVSNGNQQLEEKACLMALNAGVDILLHPDNPERVIDYLSGQWDKIMPGVENSFKRILKAKKELNKIYPSLSVRVIGAKSHWKAASELTQKSLNIVGFNKSTWANMRYSSITSPKEKVTVLVIDDDNCESGTPFIKAIKTHYKNKKVKTIYIDNKYEGDIKTLLDSITDLTLIVAVFSKVSAWKGRSGLSRELMTLLKKAAKVSKYAVIIGFCSPYILHGLKADALIEAYSDSELVQKTAAKILCNIFSPVSHEQV